MNINAQRIAKKTVAFIFWISVWQITAIIVDKGFIIPTVEDTAVALWTLIKTSLFWKSVLFSLLRILAGLALGVALGIALALIANKVKYSDSLIAPAMSVIKSTPVASFILILWFMLGSDSVPIAISVLMVMPVIWQNLTDGFEAIDKDLDEVCSVFRLSYAKRLKILVLPTLMRFFLPGLITSCGLAWKAGVAAEIITYTKNSLGKEILDAKNYFESERMFALTIVVIVLSMLIEAAIKFSVGALKRNESANQKSN